MQIGQTIWAIDPCEMTFTKEKALIVGKEYTVKSFNKKKNSFEITSEIDTLHTFLLKNFDDYFSLTPPEGKGGDKAEEIYHRFVQYEWNEISEGLKKSILNAINEALNFNSKS